MASTAATLLGQALVAVAAVGAYHVLFSSAGGGHAHDSASTPADAADAIEALRRDVDALRRAAPAGATGDLSGAKLDALFSRIAAIEQRVIPASVEAGANNARLPSGVGEKAGSWSEEQLQSLRAMMDEVEARRNTDRETASYRDLVKRVAPTLSAADEAAAVSLLTRFMRTIRSIYSGGSAGNTADERAAANARAAAERAKLFQDLRAFLAKEVIDELSPHIPEFGVQPPHLPPNK